MLSEVSSDFRSVPAQDRSYHQHPPSAIRPSEARGGEPGAVKCLSAIESAESGSLTRVTDAAHNTPAMDSSEML